MWRRIFLVTILLGSACSGVDTLTSESLDEAEQKWKASSRPLYRIVIDMSGDRVEASRFEATVREGRVVNLRRNGLVISPGSGQDYSMEGLFNMLRQEIGLAERPSTLGAPAGYSVYMQAQFDDTTGRLIRYIRSVGGTSNTIEIEVVEFEEN